MQSLTTTLASGVPWQVDATAARFGTATYPISAISSLRVACFQQSPGLGLFCLAVGGYGTWAGWSGFWWIGLILLALWLLWPQYLLYITAAGGECQAIKSWRRGEISEIHAAIQDQLSLRAGAALAPALTTIDGDRTIDVDRMIGGNRVPCPHCAELILPTAKVCRFCGHDVPLILGLSQAV